MAVYYSLFHKLDDIGSKRFDSDLYGVRELQRNMLELLMQLDGYSPDDRIKVIAAMADYCRRRQVTA